MSNYTTIVFTLADLRLEKKFKKLTGSYSWWNASDAELECMINHYSTRAAQVRSEQTF